MANFNPAFGNNAVRRFPEASERSDGFPCGPADQALFNGMFFRIEEELRQVIVAGGLTPNDLILTQVRDAIQALIDAATGGGDPNQFVLMTQARARLPIFPDVLTAGGHLSVTSPSTGQVRVPSGGLFQHRGIFQITTAQTDFATLASKTYHLRWSATFGFQLKDLSDTVSYNPTSAPEADARFDSTYDDMLVARVITNGSNIATITNLINRDRLTVNKIIQGTNGQSIGTNGARFDFADTLNWARTPTIWGMPFVRVVTASPPTDADQNVALLGQNPEIVPAAFDVNRYRMQQTIMRDDAQELAIHWTAKA